MGFYVLYSRILQLGALRPEGGLGGLRLGFLVNNFVTI